MTIELISQEQFDIITNIYKKYPVLTLQNDGYEYIREKFNEAEEKARQEVVQILSKHIVGFSSFTNFRLSKKESKLQLRFDYNYGAEDNSMSFIGVGYLLLDELLNGFKEK